MTGRTKTLTGASIGSAALAVAGVALSQLGASGAGAQQSFPPGQFALGGIPVGCGPAWTVVAPIPDWAMARPTLGGTSPTIYLNPVFLAQAPLPVQMFTYAHECGHLVVGPDENAADCWAAQLGRDQGWFSEGEMRYLVDAFAWNPGDWFHAPGPVRLQSIWGCYQSG
jgi:hypothetical protein